MITRLETKTPATVALKNATNRISDDVTSFVCMNRRWRVFLIFCFAALAMCIRIRHERLGWGGYWQIDIVAPWHR
jgi:hypothetical protein